MEANRVPAAPAGKRWLITGCASGIGALLAQTLLDQGVAVVATDRYPAELAGLRGPRTEQLLALPMDLRQPAQIRQAVAAALEAGPIDILVNNAAIFLGGPFEELNIAAIEEVFAVNTFGAMRVSQALIPAMRERGQGRIINISSDAGLFGMPFGSPYSAAKWALEGFSEALSHELSLVGLEVALLEICGSYATSMRANALANAEGQWQASPYAAAIGAKFAKAKAQAGSDGDPLEVVAAIIALAGAPDPPLRTLVGPQSPLMELRRTLGDEAFIQSIRKKIQP